MTTLTNTSNNNFGNTIDERKFLVIHPLFDEPEEKKDTEKVGKMKMTKSVKYSLMALRVYLILMIGLSIYRTLVLAGVLGH